MIDISSTATVTNNGNQPLGKINVLYQIFSSKGPIYNLQPFQTNNTTYSCLYTLTIKDTINGNKSLSAIANSNYEDPYFGFSIINESASVEVVYNSAPAALPDAMIETESGDVYINEAENGVILKSPSGNCYRIRIEDDGTLRSEPIICP